MARVTTYRPRHRRARPRRRHLAAAELPKGERRQVELAQRLHEAEAGFLVIGQRVGGDDAPVMAS